MARHERQLTGLEYLEAVTTLLQRIRAADAIKGVYEAADLQWWWRSPRSTDEIGQLFWFDDLGRPEAAVILTQWETRQQFDPMVMPDVDPVFLAHVIERGIPHAAASGFTHVELEVDRGDRVQQNILAGQGFSLEGEAMVEAWMSADALPDISPLADGYRLTTRAETAGRPHFRMMEPDAEQRLQQTSLYRSDLDVSILEGDDNYAAHGLFWYDPVTATGSVEPMRTEDAHQRRGLARHLLTAGVNLLARAGAERIKIAFEPSNPGASKLYPDVGFVPVKHTDAYSGTVG